MTSRLLVIALLAACGGGGGGPTEPDAAVTGWQPLITKGWTLEPGGENTSDIAIDTLTADMIVGGIRPIAPAGTHHTVLGRGGTESGNIIYASGVGTNELTFPTGIGLRLTADTLIFLQLHIFNLTDEPISGTSGIEVLVVEPGEVTQEVDLFLPGPTELALPPNQESTVTGTCTVSSAQTLFALFPHMHQLGSHFKTTLTMGGVDTVIHDSGYAFDEQAFLEVGPFELSAGDKIKTDCTWNNTTPGTIGWGESSTTEMCFSILYRFPARAGEFCNDE
jgi:hypothetical protein